jgi:hypothetical protein
MMRRRERWVRDATRVAAVAVVIVTVVTSVVTAVVASTATPARAAEPPAASVSRVLILSMPAVSYRDLDLTQLPNLGRLLSDSALADLSVRGVRRRPSLGDGYVTIGAGTRSVGRAADDGQCLSGDEPYEDGTAAEAMARRTGIAAEGIPDGGIVCLAQPSIAARNDDLLFDARIGAFAEALETAGVDRAVIGNADQSPPSGATGYARQVGLSLADPHGVVTGGAVGQELMTPDPEAPFGLSIATDAYLAAFDRSWTDRSVVVVEASDLVRYDAYRPFVSRFARAALQQHVLQKWDALVGALLERVDPAHDAVMVVGPAHMGGTARLTMATLRAPGVEPGLLRSAYTRRSGVVSIVDVAPTVLHLLGIERPSEMEGRTFEVGRTGGDFEDRLAWLIDTDEAARFRDRMIAPVTTFFAVAEIVLIVVAVLCFARYRPGLRAVELGALALLGFPPAVYLARLLPFHDWGWLAYWAFLIGASCALAAVSFLLTNRWGLNTLIVMLTIVVGVVAVDIVTGARLQFNSTLGYSPTVAGRYAGIGNLGYAQLSAGALLLAGLVAARVAGRRGVLLAIALLAVVFVVDGAPFFGADVGGVLSIVPAYALTATLLLGWRVRWRSLLLYGAAAAVLIGLFAAYDAGRPEDSQTHLGRLVHTTTDDGWSAFATVIERKISANLAVLFRSSWTAMLPIVLIGVLYLVYFAPGRLRPLLDRMPPLRAAFLGLIVLGVLGFAFNDSGIAVPAMMIGVVSPVVIVLTARGERVLPQSAPDAEQVRELVRT